MGVLPQSALVEWTDFPPPAALRASTSPASGRGAVNPLTADSIKSHHALAKITPARQLSWIAGGYGCADQAMVFREKPVGTNATAMIEFASNPISSSRRLAQLPLNEL
jgi:hypothetical protein